MCIHSRNSPMTGCSVKLIFRDCYGIKLQPKFSITTLPNEATNTVFRHKKNYLIKTTKFSHFVYQKIRTQQFYKHMLL